MTKLCGHPCRGESVFSVLQDRMARSAGMQIDRLCRPPLTNVEPHDLCKENRPGIIAQDNHDFSG